MRTEEPTWLNEAYSEAIASTDLGLISRNLRLRDITHAVLAFCLRINGEFVDFGGGYGLFTRLMRDRGFDFLWEDPLCSNLFAKGFEASPGRTYAALTCFEVFEHLLEPVNALEQMLARSDCILFSTEVLPDPAPKPEEWWYYALESGQHISLYTIASLKALARNFGLHLYTNGRSLHLLTKRSVSKVRFRFACSGKLAPLLSRLYRKRSLLPSDHAAVLARLR